MATAPMRVTDELKWNVLASFSDESSRRVIGAVASRPKSATEIEGELGLPHSTLYRKLERLRRCGLVMVESFALRPDGKKEALYACTFSQVRIGAAGGEVEVEVQESARGRERRRFRGFGEGPAEDRALGQVILNET